MTEPRPTLLSSGWLTTEETMEALGIRKRTVQKWAQEEVLHWKMQSVAGRKPERLYDRRDIERLKREGPPRRPQEIAPRTKMHGVAHAPSAPSAYTPSATQTLELALPAFAMDKIAAAGIAIATAFDAHLQKKPVVPISEKLWLSLEEAADYSGLVRADLLRLIQAGTLQARKSGGWKILRESLEAFKG